MRSFSQVSPYDTLECWGWLVFSETAEILTLWSPSDVLPSSSQQHSSKNNLTCFLIFGTLLEENLQLKALVNLNFVIYHRSDNIKRKSTEPSINSHLYNPLSKTYGVFCEATGWSTALFWLQDTQKLTWR